MAPELLAGRPATTRSDIYALGLILFEIFTGRRAFEATTIAALRQQHDTRGLPTPSAIVPDLDPVVERVIQRCLARDPEQRPASALTVAVALPGGDPLAAALAAGETPSPDVLAAAAESDALPVARGVALLSVLVASIAIYVWLSPKSSIAALVPLEKPPAVLADRAQQAGLLAGLVTPGVDYLRAMRVRTRAIWRRVRVRRRMRRSRWSSRWRERRERMRISSISRPRMGSMRCGSLATAACR